MQKELTGTIKALLNEYKAAIDELILVIKNLKSQDIILMRDNKTTDANCRSVQTILTHLVYAGYNYTSYIGKLADVQKEIPPKKYLANANDYVEALNKMLAYCEDFFIEHPSIPIEGKDNSQRIETHWGQQYDIEQLMEHAIVHMLKHTKQIERFTSALE
jgi:uncharacterized damage-inducible protein DinB